MINFLNYTDGVIIFQAVFFLRNFHLVRLLVELREFEVVVTTTKNLAVPFLSMIVSVYTVYYMFAIGGEIWFGGKVRVNSIQSEDPSIPNFYFLVNFNDFGCSLVTLFHIMIVNNWYVTCNMFSEIAGNDYPRFFFVAFWILVVLIMLNCVLSILIEVYGSAQEKIDEQFEKRDLAL